MGSPAEVVQLLLTRSAFLELEAEWNTLALAQANPLLQFDWLLAAASALDPAEELQGRHRAPGGRTGGGRCAGRAAGPGAPARAAGPPARQARPAGDRRHGAGEPLERHQTAPPPPGAATHRLRAAGRLGLLGSQLAQRHPPLARGAAQGRRPEAGADPPGSSPPRPPSRERRSRARATACATMGVKAEQQHRLEATIAWARKLRAFVTDEISLPTEEGKIVCDLLALRRDGGRCVPVLLELKDARLFSARRPARGALREALRRPARRGAPFHRPHREVDRLAPSGDGRRASRGGAGCTRDPRRHLRQEGLLARGGPPELLIRCAARCTAAALACAVVAETPDRLPSQ